MIFLLLIFFVDSFNYKVNATKATRYNFIGADSACHYLDYAFCEVVKDREIPESPNVPFGQHIQIRSIKTSVNNSDEFVYVKKVGRTTFLREGLIQDMWVPFYPPIVKRKGRKEPKERSQRFALLVFGINKQTFCKLTDFILAFYFVFLIHILIYLQLNVGTPVQQYLMMMVNYGGSLLRECVEYLM